MEAKVRVSVNGGALTDLPVVVSKGDEVSLVQENLLGIRSISWRAVGTAGPSVSINDLQDLLFNGQGGVPFGRTCTFTVPSFAGNAGQAFLIKVVLNDGRNVNGEIQDVLTASFIVGVANSQGVVPLAVFEENEWDETYGVFPRVNAALNAVGGGGGGGVSPPVSPTDNGKVAIALNGDLSYGLVKDAQIASDASITVQKLKPGGELEILQTESGEAKWRRAPASAILPGPMDDDAVAVAASENLSYTKLYDVHVHADANIEVNKLHEGSEGQYLKTVSGVPVWDNGPVLLTKPVNGVDDGRIAVGNAGDLAYLDKISGSRVDPSFGAQDVKTAGYLEVDNGSSNMATTGQIRGNSAGGWGIMCGTVPLIGLAAGRVNISNSGAPINFGRELLFDDSVVSANCLLGHRGDSSTAQGKDLKLRGQASNAVNNRAGNVIIEAGVNGSSGGDGKVLLVEQGHTYIRFTSSGVGASGTLTIPVDKYLVNNGFYLFEVVTQYGESDSVWVLTTNFTGRIQYKSVGGLDFLLRQEQEVFTNKGSLTITDNSWGEQYFEFVFAGASDNDSSFSAKINLIKIP